MRKKQIGWNFDNSYLNLPDLFFSKIEANPVTSPELVVFNDDLGKSLGLNIDALKSKEGIDILAGNQFPKGASQIAQAYAGHQFGYFTMLGDGRAVLIGEQIKPTGGRVDIQLKGSGQTPYSRRGDGRAPLAPMLREYMISESMHHMGIPTTRSLAVVKTGDQVYRESPLPGAVLTRVASSHIRVGTFEYASRFGNLEDLRALADYTIKRHFPLLINMKNPYLGLLKQVVKTQAALVAKWRLVGFVHGVMNTDNMAISGETIDYGPCAFMDEYRPKRAFSSIDKGNRYAYDYQPEASAWNVTKLAEALLPLIHENSDQAIEMVGEVLQNCNKLEYDYWEKGMELKLGLFDDKFHNSHIVIRLSGLMNKYKVDFTNLFTGLTVPKYQELDQTGFFKSNDFKIWYEMWRARLKVQDPSLGCPVETMKKHNPVIIPRNHQVEKALELASQEGDYTLYNDLLKALSKPYDYDGVNEAYMEQAESSDRPYRTFCGT